MFEETRCPGLEETRALWDRELDIAAARQARAHAAECPVCAEELAQLDRLARVLTAGDPAAAGTPGPRSSMKRSLLAACAESPSTPEARRGTPWLWSRRVAAGVAIGLSGLVLAVLLRHAGVERQAVHGPLPEGPARVHPTSPPSERRTATQTRGGRPAPGIARQDPAAAGPSETLRRRRQGRAIPEPRPVSAVPRHPAPRPAIRELTAPVERMPERLVIEDDGGRPFAPAPAPAAVSITASSEPGQGRAVVVHNAPNPEVKP